MPYSPDNRTKNRQNNVGPVSPGASVHIAERMLRRLDVTRARLLHSARRPMNHPRPAHFTPTIMVAPAVVAICQHLNVISTREKVKKW